MLVALHPHAHAHAQALLRTKSSQSFVISGESGAGKSESTKHIINHVMQLCKAGKKTLESQIMSMNPLLEAFGNAKTVMNNMRDDASSVSALPAPARCQETSFDTNSQINMFYNNSESKHKKSQDTATFVELRASQEIARIPGAKSPFLRLSDDR